MSKLPNNKLKLEVKSSETEIAKFISTENAEIIIQSDYITTNHNYSKIGASIQESSNNPFKINAYFGTHDDNNIASFNITNTDLNTTTIIHGNLIIDGSTLSLGTYILNDDTDVAFSNFPKSAYSNLISERYTSLLISNIVNTSNTILDTVDRTHTSLYNEVINMYTLENLFKGISFTFFTDADFDNMLASKTLDNIANGSRNKYIQNKTYPNDLVVNTSLIASNYTALSMSAEKVYANKLYGDGSQLTNVFKGDGTTSTITEGSNLFFTIERALPIIIASNIHSSNFIAQNYSNLLLQEYDMHYNLSNYTILTCNQLYDNIQYDFANISNIITTNVQDIYSYLYSCNLYISNIQSDFISAFSNIVDNSINDLNYYIYSSSNQLADNLIYNLINISNYITSLYIFDQDLFNTSNEIIAKLYDYSNIHITELNYSEQNANDYVNISSNFINANIDTYVTDSSNQISLTFDYLYNYLDTNTQSVLISTTTTQSDLTSFINNSNDIQNIANSYTSNALVHQIDIGMSNIIDYIVQTEGHLSNLIIENYEITSNDIENLSNYIIMQTSDLTSDVNIRVDITSNFIQETSNFIISDIIQTFDRQLDDVSSDIYNISNIIVKRIQSLTCDEINEGENKYFTTSRFYSNISALSLDDIHNGITKKFIVNNVYDGDLTISCNLYASNLSIIGNDTVLMTSTINTNALEILSTAFAPALTVTQLHPTQNILEAYNYQSNLVFAVGRKAIQIGQSNIANKPNEIIKNYIHYEFKSQSYINIDSSSNNNNFTNYGGVYIFKAERNSILLNTGNKVTLPSNNWSTYNNLSISFWMNTDNFTNGDRIIEFSNASANISILQNEGQLIFQINGTIIYRSNYIQNVWNHILWNISTISTQTYIIINGETIQYFNKIPLISVLYTNTLGNIANSGSIYLSDFRIITTPSNSILENIYAYTKDTFTVNVYGTVKASNFIGSGAFLYDVNITDKTTSELREDLNGNNLYYTDARANNIIDSSNNHMSNLIANVSNILSMKQNYMISSEQNYLKSTSNMIVKFINDTYKSQSNLILSTSNSLMQKATSIVLNANQSNYVLSSSNILMNILKTNENAQSNYIITSSNVLATIITLENTKTSNYIGNYVTNMNVKVTSDYVNVSNYIKNSSNSIMQSFISLQTQQSNYTSIVSNLFTNQFNTYQTDTSNYILSMSNTNIKLFIENNVNVSNYVKYFSNVVADKIKQIITNNDTQGVQSGVNTTINRWQEPSQYITTFNVNTLANNPNYIQYNEGNIGIGTMYPTATLDIFTKNSSMNSIKVNNNIWAQTGIVNSSDVRIKKDIVDIDDGEALNKILSIKPMIYDYIDNHRHQNKKDVYGFIAQQIATVIPEAISLQTEAIPNIYCFGTIYNNILMISNDVGNIVDILTEGAKLAILCNKSKYIVTIDEIYSLNVYHIINNYNIDGTVFVYGTIVTDFHTLDKNYIYTLNVCATQDLHRKQQIMFNNIENLKEQYQLNTLHAIEENVNATKQNMSNLDAIQYNILQTYDIISTEYNRLDHIHSNYMATMINDTDIQHIYDRINQLKLENDRINIENTKLSSSNQVLKIKLADVATKVGNIRNILQNNNII